MSDRTPSPVSVGFHTWKLRGNPEQIWDGWSATVFDRSFSGAGCYCFRPRFTALPFFARTCRALGIPYLVLHDEDIYAEVGEGDVANKIRQQNAESEALNRAIADAVPSGKLFMLKPSLEGVLGISRDAREKPRRIAEAIEKLGDADVPGPLRDAVAALFAEDNDKTLD